MVQSVELLLDEQAEAAVRRQWELLAAAGLPRQAASSRPHITVAVADEIRPRIDARLAELEFTPFQVHLGGLLVFGSRTAILVRAVVPSADLLDLHARVDRTVDGCPGMPSNTRQGRWTPHVTLVRRLPLADLGKAVSTIAGEPEIRGTVAAIRRWDGDARREWLVTP